MTTLPSSRSGVPSDASARAPEPAPTPALQHRGDIQGLRAVAVLLVVVGHFGFSWFPGGYVGVDVFFVISGFLITGILVKGVRTSGRVSLVDFYVRRARRILPAATVALIGILVASTIAYTAARLLEVRDDIVWAAFFGANIRFGTGGTDYFDQDSFTSPVQHFWSLAVEEQFYLVWPVVIIACTAIAGLAARRTHHRDAAWHRTATLRAAIVLLLLITAASLAWSISQTRTDPLWAYFSPFTRAWELGLGGLLALAASVAGRLPRPLKALLSWGGLALIGYAATQFTDQTPFPGSAALVPVVGAALVLAGGLGGPAYGAQAVLSLAPMRWVGDISYSLYLWHWPLAVMPVAWLGRDLRLRETLVLIAAAVLLSWLSYRFVETPFRGPRATSARRRRARPARALVLWPVSIALVLGSAGAVSGYHAWQDSRGGEYVAPDVDPEPDTKQEYADDLRNDVSFAAELARAGHPLPDHLTPGLADLEDDVVSMRDFGGPDCFASSPEVEVEICPIGDVDADRTWVVLGDSHMGMWLGAIDALAKEAGIRVVPFTKQRCMPLGLEPVQGNGVRGYPQCPRFLDWVVEQIPQFDPERIVLSGLWTVGLTDPDTGEEASVADSDEMFTEGARTTFSRLLDLAPDVRVIGPTPILPDFAANCLGSTRATMSACAEPPRKKLVRRGKQLAEAAADVGATYVDVLPWFCDKGTCPLVVRDRIVYRDQDHVTGTYIDRLTPMLRRQLGF